MKYIFIVLQGVVMVYSPLIRSMRVLGPVAMGFADKTAYLTTVDDINPALY